MPNYEEFVIPKSPIDPCEVILHDIKWAIPEADCVKYATTLCPDADISTVGDAIRYLEQKFCDPEVPQVVAIDKEFLIKDDPEIPLETSVKHEDIVYVKVSVFSSLPLTSVVVRDVLPPQLVHTGDNPFPWNSGIVGIQGKSIIFPVKVNFPTGSGDISNTAQVTVIDGVVTNDVIASTATLHVDNDAECSPNLHIEKTLNKVNQQLYVGQNIVPGDNVEFKIVVTNNANCDYDGGDVLDDSIPDIFQFTSASPANDSYVAPTVKWTLPAIPALSSVIFLLSASAVSIGNGRTNCSTIKDSLANVVASDCITGLSVVSATENIPPIAGFEIESFPIPPNPAPVPGCLLVVTDTSQDPDGQVVKWQYNWGDGTPDTVINRGGAVQSGDTGHTYPFDSTPKVITLTVTDNEGATDTAVQEFLCVPSGVPPTASFSVSDCTGGPPFLMAFSNDSIAGTYPIVSYLWEWGDGTPNSTTEEPTHQFTAPVSYTVKLTVTDQQGASDTTQLIVDTALCDEYSGNTETVLLSPNPNIHLFNPWTGFSGMGRAFQAVDHPLSTMFYLRGTAGVYGGLTWGDFEPTEGNYNFSKIGQALDDAATHPRNTPGHPDGTNTAFPYNSGVDVQDRATVNLRVIMMDCSNTNATPSWVKSHQQSDPNADPVINGSAYIPDYEDPWYLGKRSAFLNALNNYIQAHPRFNRLNFIDIGLGSSGEWHHGGAPCGACESQHLPSISVAKQIIDQFFSIFQKPSNPRKIQLVASFGMQNVPGQANGGFELMKYATEKGAGWRADFYGRCVEFGRMCNMINSGATSQSTQGCGSQPSSLVGTNAMRDAWKNGSVNLEPWNDMTRWASKDSAQVPKNCSTPCAGSSTDYLGVLRFGTQKFNANSAINMGVPFQPTAVNGATQAQIDEIKAAVQTWMLELGYRLVIESVEYPPNVTANQDFFIKVKVGNHGSAPNYTHYSDYNVRLTLTNGAGWTYTPKGLGKILPGESKTVSIPANITTQGGPFGIKLRVTASLDPLSALIPIHLGNDGNDGNYEYTVPGAQINVAP